MAEPIILASASSVRSDLLKNAGVKFTTEVSRIDEDAVRHSMLAASASPRDIADALATAKARKISLRRPDALVIGCDQVLELHGKLLTKPSGRAEARAQLGALAGTRH
ncbi:MAG: nucleoside triphosphate pyrophosphatase, partial [Halocynthiibacter sp.]